MSIYQVDSTRVLYILTVLKKKKIVKFLHIIKFIFNIKNSNKIKSQLFYSVDKSVLHYDDIKK